MLIVIIHGLASNPDRVRYIGKSLVRRLRGSRYICPSYFMLPSPGQNKFALNTQVGDVAEQIDREREGREPLVIVGHSYGGYIASRLGQHKFMNEKIFSVNTPFLKGRVLQIKHMDDPIMVGTLFTDFKHMMHPKGKGVHFACITCYNIISTF